MEPRIVTLRLRTLVFAVAVALVVGLGISGLVRTPAHPKRESGSAASSPRPSSTSARRRPSRANAVTAATVYVRLGQHIFDLPPDQRAAALRAIASRSAAEGYVATQAAQLAELDGVAQRGSGPLTWNVSVLATRLDAFTPTRARVSVWRVGVLSIEGLTAPLSEWTIVTYELVWERHAWRIWSETQAPGPTPMGHPEETPSTPGQMRAALDGFVRYPDGEAR